MAILVDLADAGGEGGDAGPKAENGGPSKRSSGAPGEDLKVEMDRDLGQGVAVSKRAVPGASHFALPDGSWAPALNGVRNAPKMDWPPEIPWSPIRRKILGKDGKEYYEHFDGSYSTTQMIYRSDLGRKEAVTQVMNPQKVQGQSPKEFGPRAKRN